MISFTEDSELMTNLLPANPVPAGNRFVAIRDADSNPALVSLSQDNKLDLIIKQVGAPKLVDLGSLYGLTAKVLAFDVYQDLELNLWFAIATDAGNNQCNFYLIVNVAAKDILTPPSCSIVSSEAKYPLIHAIFISNFVDTVGSYKLPMIFLAFQPPSIITATDQLGYLDIKADPNNRLTFTLNQSWKLATDPLQILAVTFGTAVVGKGAFVLYRSIDGLHLQFRTFKAHDFSVEIQVPPGALSLNSYLDPSTGTTVLLVGGDHITSYTSKQYVVPNGKGTVIATGETSLGVKDLQVSLAAPSLTLWYTTAQDAVHYYSANFNDLSNGLLVPLLPESKGGQISGLLSSPSNSGGALVHTLLSVNETGYVTMLQQSTDTGMWEPIPFYTPSQTNNMEIPSYTVRVTVVADGSSKTETTPNCQIHLVSTDRVQVTANGSVVTLSPDGEWVTCDGTGCFTFIIATNDLSCTAVKIDRYKSKQGFEEAIPGDFIVNPTHKCLNSQSLQAIKTGEDLLSAKTQNGEPLVPPGTLPSDQADSAAGAISSLTNTRPDGLRATVPLFRKPTRRVYFTDEDRCRKPVHVAGVLPREKEKRANMMQLNSFSSAWDFFNWLWEEAKAIVNWSLQKLGDLYHLVIEWAGDVYRFVLDTVQAVGKAVSWIFNKIKVAVEKLIEFIGFLFAWDDILTTADSINVYLNAGLSYGVSQIDGLKKVLDTCIENIISTVNTGEVKPTNTATASNQQDTRATPQTQGIQGGVAYNFGAYHMQHSGFATASTIEPKPTQNPAADDSELQQIWDSCSKEVDTVKWLVERIAADIKDLFTPGTDTDQVFARLKSDMTEAALKTLKNVADILLSALALVIQEFQDLGNAPIKVPVFGALWDWITKGRPFTLFNCLSLILAIPTTILYKLAAQKAPPKLSGRVTEKTFQQFVTGDPGLDPELFRDMYTVATCTTVTAGALGFVATAIAFVTDSVVVASSEDGVAVGPALGNAIDGALIFFDTLGLVLTWPLKHKHDQDLHWAVWGLDLSNALFLALSRIVGYKFNIKRVETKRFVGVWEVVTSIPTYVIAIIIDVNEFDTEGNDDALTTRHIVEETATLVSSWAFGVAALADEVQEEVTLVALAVMGIAIALGKAFQFVDFVVWVQGSGLEGPGPQIPHSLPPQAKDAYKKALAKLRSRNGVPCPELISFR